MKGQIAGENEEKTMRLSLTGLSVIYDVKEKRSAIETHDQLDGHGRIWNKALVIPGHLGGLYNSLEYVMLDRATEAEPIEVGEHRQQTDEIYFIAEGVGHLTSNGLPYTVTKGDVVIAPKGTVHGIQNRRQEPLSFFVAELHTPTNQFCQDKVLTLHPNAPLDLSPHFSSPAWDHLHLLELLPGRRMEEVWHDKADHNLFLVSGHATIIIEQEHRFDSGAFGFNVFVPAGVLFQIINRSSVEPLFVLILTVHHDAQPGTREALTA